MLAPGVELVREVRNGQANLLFTERPRTSDGRPVQVQACCFAIAPRTLRLGGRPDVDLTMRACSLRMRGQRPVLAIEAGDQPIRVVVTVTAPATADAKGYRDEVLYQVR